MAEIATESVYSYFNRHTGEGSKQIMTYFNRRYRADEVKTEIARVAGFLRAKGIGAGDTVGVALPNLPEGVFAFYAANRIGAAVNLMHPKISSALMERQLAGTRTKLLFLYDGVYKQHRDMLERLGIDVVLCSVSGAMKGALKLAMRAVEPKGKGFRFSSIPHGLPSEEGDCPDGICAYIHSGGTGGEPKTVALTNRNLNGLADTLVDTMWSNRRADEAMLMMLPYFHGFGLGVPMHTALCYGRSVLVPVFQPKRVLKVLQKENVTFLAGIPAMYRKLLDERGFGGEYLRGIRYLFCGGDSLGEDLRLRFNAQLKKYGAEAELLQGYGLTEATTVVTVCRAGQVKPNSVGTPLNGMEVEILDENGTPLPTGERGEIYVKSVTLMAGYLNDPAASAETLIERAGEIWCRTGDIGYLDEDGQLYFIERRKRSLKISGVNVFPAEIERAAKEIDGVKDCCAARKTDERGKPYVELWVVADKGFSDSEAVCKGIGARLNAYSVPRKIQFTDEIKRTAVAKVDYRYYETL